MIKIIRGLNNIREKHAGAVVTIGNFDGVHIGHQMILRRVNQEAKRLKTQSMLAKGIMLDAMARFGYKSCLLHY